MIKKRKALESAIETLEHFYSYGFDRVMCEKAIVAIKDDLEKPEPVAWMHTKLEGVVIPHRPADLNKYPDRWEPLYKAHQQFGES